MTCYGIGSTEKSVKTACGKWLRRGSEHWTTAARVVKCPLCLNSDSWILREGRFGVGDSEVQVEADIAMRPEHRELRNTMTRRQKKALLDGPVG